MRPAGGPIACYCPAIASVQTESEFVSLSDWRLVDVIGWRRG